jgi:uncharacterized protein YecA (UPF0149 family)
VLSVLQYQQVYQGPDSEEHKSKFSHELIGGALAYEATKGQSFLSYLIDRPHALNRVAFDDAAYEDHERKNGKPESHARAKEIIAGLVGAEADKCVCPCTSPQ